ncbi:hypothetical protein [Glycomyces sp. NPDC021274]|uniref:hypothetical protein n=1 Tax=Glycomyces sp. NPDC021274 TaxID=3155120 RepID=UPI0033ECF197
MNAAAVANSGAEQLEPEVRGELQSLGGSVSWRECKDHRQVVREFTGLEAPSAGRIDLLDPGQLVAASSCVAGRGLHSVRSP